MRTKAYLKYWDRWSYVKEELLRQANILDCSLGRNPFGVSDKVVTAAQNYSWVEVHHYPDPFHSDLRVKIVDFWNDCAELKVEQVQVAGGAIGVLERLNKVFIEPGSRVLGYSPQFSEYVTEIEASGGKYDAVVLRPEENFKFYTERLLRMMSQEHCLIYLDNPNNPTGQAINLNEIEEIVNEAGKRQIVVVVDEAFGDFLEERETAITLMNKYENLIVIRSFSKGLGLASLRVGYGIFPLELARYYKKVNVPFAASTIGCYLAREALSDKQFIRQCREMVKREKKKLMVELKQRGYLVSETLDSCPIFVLGHPNETIDLKQELLTRGILTESGKDFRNLGSNYVRVNIPPKAEDFLARL